MMLFLGIPTRPSTVTIPDEPPAPGSKTTEAPILQAKGLSFIWQDRLGETDEPADDRQFFQTTTGNRVSEDPDTTGTGNRRLSFAMYEGRRCMKATYAANAPGWLNYRAQYLPQRYTELGLCVDFIYPAGYDLQNIYGGNTSGKSLFGLLCGHPDHQKPGLPSYPRAWTGAVTWPEDQWGAELGINWTYRASNPGGVEYDWYAHVIGAYVNGADQFRRDKFSNLFNISGYAAPAKQRFTTGAWHRLELYGKMDTNRRDGVLEMWIDGVLRARCPNLDLGGWVGNRGLAKGTIGGSDSAGSGQLVGSSGGGWRFQGIFIREMIGGVTNTPEQTPKYGGSYYAYNWRVYGKL
jgi:hypothetical protein